MPRGRPDASNSYVNPISVLYHHIGLAEPQVEFKDSVFMGVGVGGSDNGSTPRNNRLLCICRL